MLSRLTKLIFAIFIKLLNSLKRFPESLLLITIAIFILIDDNHLKLIRNTFKNDFGRLPMMLFFGFVAFLCYRMLNENGIFEKRTLKIFSWITFAAFIVLYYFFILPDLKPASIIRYIAVVFALTMSFLFIPYMKRKEGFELYIIKIFIGVLITYLYAFVLFLGLVAILFTVDQLFSLHVSSKLYFDIWLIVAGIFAPSYFLGSIPKKDAEHTAVEYSKVLKILLLYIVMPILAVYTLILYAYFAKVIISQIWPQGMVSNLVLWYSFIAAAIIFLIKPLVYSNIWVEKFSKTMPYAIIPLLLMCFWAMGIRIKNYGITESRYYVLVGAAWVLFTMIYWLVRRGGYNIILPISLAIIAIITIVGPQSAFSISFRSQTDRLENILQRNDMLKDGLLVKAEREISNQDKSDINSILKYISNIHSLKDVKFLPKDFELYTAKDILGFEIVGEYNQDTEKYHNYIAKDIQPVDISGYSFYADMTRMTKEKSKIKSKEVTIDYDPEKGVLEIYKQNKKIYEKSFITFIDVIEKENKNNTEVDAGKMTFIDKQENLEVKYVFVSLAFKENVSGYKSFNNAEFSIFIK